jgi:hypothetical protein
MTKEEFENGYCERSEITKEFYNEHFVTLPCDCDYKGCEGWACINNDPLSIEAHTRNWS